VVAGEELGRPEAPPALELHLEETKGQAARLRTCLEQLGEDTSTLKDAGGKLLAGPITDDELEAALAAVQDEHSAELGLALSLEMGESKHTFTYVLRTPAGVQLRERSYGGPIVNAASWAVSISLEALRRQLSAVES